MPGLTVDLPFNQTVGQSIPADTPHAVSVSLPTWRSNVAYEEGESWVLDKMQTGYPRFFIHKSIDRLAELIVRQYGSIETEKAMLLHSLRCAQRCLEFMKRQNPTTDASKLRIVHFVPNPEKSQKASQVIPRISAVVYPKELWPTAKAFWQHTGEGCSSRRAEYCQKALENHEIMPKDSFNTPTTRLSKGPRRYQRISVDHSNTDTSNGHTNGHDTPTNGATDSSALFVEERFGRNLDVALATHAKLAVRRRIAGCLTTTSDDTTISLPPTTPPADLARHTPGFPVSDVYLYANGMNAIFHSHQSLLASRGALPSIMYGFPYVDTLKILEKFGPGVQFYGYSSAAELDDLESRLQKGERFLALYCEFPGNPLLRSPDLKRIRRLADRYDFAVVVDETIGNFLNVHVLPYADIVVSSLTKIFSGDCNVMGGALILNPHSPYYESLKSGFDAEYEDNHFEEDSIYLERNSRDFAPRIARINENAEVIASILHSHPAVKATLYPLYSETRPHYDACRLPNGGYGGLLSATFHRMEDAQVFFDHLDTAKGPSLGTNFTLSSPFVILAHYGELEWAARFGCEATLVRFSVGLEDKGTLERVFRTALDAIGT